MTEILAFDKSARSRDVNGFLHVAVSNISKAVVNPYFGREIPGFQSLGLDANKVYHLLRHPDELSKAAATFNNMPLTLAHPNKALSADDPQKSRIVGSLGTDAAFDGTYLKNSLAIIDAEAIAGIESGQIKEISCGYRYRPDMTPGTYNGVAYDGIMRDIQCNHVALVEKGRAGPDVVVQDQSISPPTQEHKSMPIPNTPAARRAALEAAVTDIKAKLGEDHAAELEYLQTLAADACAKPQQAEDESDEDYEKRLAALEEKEANEEAKNPEIHKPAKDTSMPETIDKTAMDAAIAEAVAKTKTETETASIAKFQAIRQAEKEVYPHIGEVTAMDSAEAVYKLALDAAKIDLTDVPPSAYRAMVGMLQKPTDRKPERVTEDAALGVDAFKKFCPDAAPLVRTF